MPTEQLSRPPSRAGERHPPRTVTRGRLVAFALIVVLALAGLVTRLVVDGRSQSEAAAADASVAAGIPRLDVDAVLAVPHVVVRSTERGATAGQVAVAPLSDPDGPRALTSLSCDRIAATAEGGICLQQETGLVTAYRSLLLDEQLQETGTASELGGVPSRARMSADGTWAASTVFVLGHSYADAQFSTQTLITRTDSGQALPDLETWTTTTPDGAEVTAADRNFWGVSFVGDGPGFYATLGTGGEHYLVRGDVDARTMQVVATNGACPSVSPDGRHVVYKEQDLQSGSYHFVVLDVGTGDVVQLPEGRVVDDQVAWLSDDTVLYAVGRGVASSVDFDIWAAPIDGGAPSRWMSHAASPSVVDPTRP